MKKILFATIALCALCACNKFKTYDGPACFYFDASKSSTTSVNEFGELEAEYYVHYTGVLAARTNTVSFSVTPGDGLKEGVDYAISTSDGKLSFLTGFTDVPVRIKWLPHTIDATKDNSLTITLESVDNPNAVVGLPGPDRKNRSIKILKYKN